MGDIPENITLLARTTERKEYGRLHRPVKEKPFILRKANVT